MKLFGFLSIAQSSIIIVTLASLSNGMKDVTSLENIKSSQTFDQSLKDPLQQNYDLNLQIDCSYRRGDFEMMANSIQRALRFLESYVERVDIDAAIGTRILLEQLQAISKENLPDPAKILLTKLLEKAKSLTNQIVHIFNTADDIPEIIKNESLAWITTKGLWNHSYKGKWKQLKKTDGYVLDQSAAQEFLLSRTETFEDMDSDICIFQLFTCDVSKVCLTRFLVDERSFYALSHQLIYTLFASKSKCPQIPDPERIEAIRENLCGEIWQEANAIAEVGFWGNLTDLFVEQVAMCGMSGYSDFLRRDWLMKILQWHETSRSGCFLDLDEPSFELSEEVNFTETPTSTVIRAKREDTMILKETKEICSAHFTAVGLEALGVHLRYLVESCIIRR